jgi:hypothetical protein
MNPMRHLLLMGLLAIPAWAQETPARPTPVERQVVAKDGQTIEVRVRVSTREEHYSTVVRFPEPILRVVSSWDPAQISVQDEETRLVLKLQAKASGYLDVVLSGGALLRLFVAGVLPAETCDSAIQIRLAGQAASPREKAAAGAASGALDLIRAMRLGEVPADVTVRTGRKEVLFRSTDIQVSLLYVYEASRFRGLVLSIENLSASSVYPLDITRFGGEALVLVGARDLVVPPGRSTRLYVVDWK